MKVTLEKIYQRLFKHFGPQHWWPGETRIEIIVGAILTQNTNWGNVKKAIHNLKLKGKLSAQALYDIPVSELASLIRPAGYFNAKAKRLKNFIHYLFKEYDGALEKMAREPFEILRPKLLSVNGIGPETADSILLYAFAKPVFVVDAYTKRIFYRHNLSPLKADYTTHQNIFMNTLEEDAQMFNEYHALLVNLGKDFCRPRPRCEECPLRDIRYSLVYKCQKCHRALPDLKDRIPLKPPPEGFLCRECR